MGTNLLLIVVLCATFFNKSYSTHDHHRYGVRGPAYNHGSSFQSNYSPQPVYYPDFPSGQHQQNRNKEQDYGYNRQPYVAQVQQQGPRPYPNDNSRNNRNGYDYNRVYPQNAIGQGAAPQQKQCQNQTGGASLYSVAEKHSAAATGSVGGIGYAYSQNFKTFCPGARYHKFRTYDGTCNHDRNLGASFTPFARLLPAQYDDGYGFPRRTGEYGNPLPNPRTVSTNIHKPQNNFIPLTHMFMQWGQWLDHDLTAITVVSDRTPVTCCPGEGETEATCARHQDCYPIRLPDNEKHFVGKCMEFVRSTAATDSYGRPLRYREQVNSVNAFIDASMVYGATPERAEQLRVKGDIYLRTKGDFPPESNDTDCIKRPGSGDYCFLTGDLRAHENPALTVLHVIWLREHNRMAKELQSLSPHSHTDFIFETTRRIIGALHQVIGYNEYIPTLFGRDAIDPQLPSWSGRSVYDPEMDPRVVNVFSAAAMRFGHSSIPSGYFVGNKFIPLRETFSRPSVVLENFQDFVMGLVGVTSVNKERAIQAVDSSFVEEVTNHLFEPANNPKGKGLDLVSLNIQRGRDHGLAPYTKWRRYCGLRPLYGFNDTEALGPYAGELARVYRSVNDIDLFVGLVHEPVDAGLIGPTTRCLLEIQFMRTKFGDRYFFDNGEPYNAFTDEQLYELRRISLAHVLCQNTKIEALPRNVFLFSGPSNPMFPCAKLREEGLNLSLFL